MSAQLSYRGYLVSASSEQVEPRTWRGYYIVKSQAGFRVSSEPGVGYFDNPVEAERQAITLGVVHVDRRIDGPDDD